MCYTSAIKKIKTSSLSRVNKSYFVYMWQYNKIHKNKLIYYLFESVQINNQFVYVYNLPIELYAYTYKTLII